MILAVDTSLPALSVALLGDRPAGSLILSGKDSRNEKLLPAIDWLLSETGIRRDQIELFVVTRGPGSFTGVRIGLATMQGLAFALSRPVCTLSTHDAAAESVEPGRSCLVFGEAGRGEVFASGYRDGSLVLAPRLVAREALGDLAEDFDRQLDLEAFAWEQNLALLAAKAGWKIRERGALAAHADVTPLYVRLSAAEEKLATHE